MCEKDMAGDKRLYVVGLFSAIINWLDFLNKNMFSLQLLAFEVMYCLAFEIKFSLGLVVRKLSVCSHKVFWSTYFTNQSKYSN